MTKTGTDVVAGVDLAGSPRRNTGICLLRGMQAEVWIAHGDEEILVSIGQVRPALVTIDAPLTLPPGRISIHDRNGEHLRECDHELRRRGIRFFPITLGPMRMLTERGMRLKAMIEEMGLRVIECYPGGALDVWGLPRQHKDPVKLLRGLRRLGIKGLKQGLSGDELDAATAALVGRWLLDGRAEMLGGEAGIVMPLPLPE